MDLKEATNRISAQAELVTKIREEVAKVTRLCHLIFSKSRSYPITTGIKPISPP